VKYVVQSQYDVPEDPTWRDEKEFPEISLAVAYIDSVLSYCRIHWNWRIVERVDRVVKVVGKP